MATNTVSVPTNKWVSVHHKWEGSSISRASTSLLVLVRIFTRVERKMLFDISLKRRNFARFFSQNLVFAKEFQAFPFSRHLFMSYAFFRKNNYFREIFSFLEIFARMCASRQIIGRKKIFMSRICQNLTSSKYFSKNGPFVCLHVADKFYIFCNELMEQSTFVNFRENFRRFSRKL
jgi:hypothetical protein